MTNSIEQLAQRIQILEDTEAIRRLKAAYCDLCDQGLDKETNLNALLQHFVADADLDFGMGEGSAFHGTEELKVFFGSVVPASVSFSMHMVHNSVIDVDGDTARGKYYFEAPTTNAVNQEAQWMAGRYLEEYQRMDGTWKFKAIRVVWNYVASYKEGWGNLAGDLKSRAAGDA